MAKRGILAEWQHQAKVAEREREQAQRLKSKTHLAAVKRMEIARKAEERAMAQAERSAEADRKRFEKEAKAAHLEAMLAYVDERNADLAERYDEIDSLLESTLNVDDFVDLDSLRVQVVHPDFGFPKLLTPTPPPESIAEPPNPEYLEPDRISGLIGVKKKRAAAEAAARAVHEAAMQRWQTEVDALPAMRDRQQQEWDDAEATRLKTLEDARQTYDDLCAERETAATEQNVALDQLITNLGYGTPEAIEEYISIVLANSAYPEHFQVTHDFTFEASTAELTLTVLMHDPSLVETTKAYKYVRASDEVTTTELSQKAQKDRYAGAAHGIALRTLHEVFEADRRGLVRSISLTVGAVAANPATGITEVVPFVAVASERDSFLAIDLASVVPTATLDHLGASVSKNPFGLVPAVVSGVRRS